MISRKVWDKNVPILMLKSQRTFACEFHPHRLPWFNWLSLKEYSSLQWFNCHKKQRLFVTFLQSMKRKIAKNPARKVQSMHRLYLKMDRTYQKTKVQNSAYPLKLKWQAKINYLYSKEGFFPITIKLLNTFGNSRCPQIFTKIFHHICLIICKVHFSMFVSKLFIWYMKQPWLAFFMTFLLYFVSFQGNYALTFSHSFEILIPKKKHAWQIS